MLAFVILFASILTFTSVHSIPFDFTSNQKHSYSGRSVVSMTSQIQTSGTNWATIPAIITIPLPKTFNTKNISELSALVTLGQFQTNDISSGLSIYVKIGLISLTQITAKIYTINASTIQKVTVFYIVCALPSEYTGNVGFYYTSIDFGTLGLYIRNGLNSPHQISCALSSPVNNTGTTSVVVMISGMVATYTNSITQAIEIALAGSLTSSTIVTLNLTSKSASSTKLNQIMANIIIYNIGFVNSAASTIYRIYDGSFSVTGSASSSYSSSLEMTSINTFVGLSSFSISYQNSLSFYLSLNQPNLISVTSDSAFSSANSFTFVYLLVLSYYCDYKTPYYSDYSSVCFSTCPGSSVSNDTTMKCECYYQGILTAETFCAISNEQKNPSSIGMIVGVAVGIFVLALIIFAAIKIYRQCPKLKQRKDNKEKEKEKEVRSKVYFDNEHINNSTLNLPLQKRIQNPPSTQNLKEPTDEAKVEQPRFHQTQIPKQVSQPDKDESGSRERISQWKKCEIKHQSGEECCICKNTHTFLRSECNHYFHLTCLSKWLAKNSTCPLCRTETKFQLRYYCNICGMAHRNIMLGSEPIDQAKFEKHCEECKEVPL